MVFIIKFRSLTLPPPCKVSNHIIFCQFTSTEDKEIVLYTFKDFWCTMSKSSYDTFIGALLLWHWLSFFHVKCFSSLHFKLLTYHFCQAHPQLKLKLQLGAEVAILSAWSTHQTTYPIKVSNWHDRSYTYKMQDIRLCKQVLEMCFKLIETSKNSPAGSKKGPVPSKLFPLYYCWVLKLYN